jgi:hypothetical protein
MADEVEQLTKTLVSNLGIVLQKFSDCYSQSFDSADISEAITQGILLINHAQLEYLCAACQDDAPNSAELRQEMMEFIQWQHKMNLEIYREKFEEVP